MYIFLIAVHVIVSLVLVLTILLQSGRGGGLSEAFGSASSSTIFGTSASTFLQRATSACAIIFLLTSLTLAVLSSSRSKSLMQLEKIKQVLPQAGKKSAPQASDMMQVPEETGGDSTSRAKTETTIPAEETRETVPIEKEAPVIE